MLLETAATAYTRPEAVNRSETRCIRLDSSVTVAETVLFSLWSASEECV